MRLLILGGTWFLGRTLAEQALQRGHQVSVFTRGKSGRDVAGAEPIRGDRGSDHDVAELARHGRWDAVLDTSGMTPDLVQRPARALADAVDRYVYVSTVNVYQGWPTQPLDDESPIRVYTPEGLPDESGTDQYGREKVGCEQEVTTVFGDRAAVLRPGVIIGPHEYVGRIPWWLRRVAAGGTVLAPGTPDWPIQPIDVRDVAAFALDAVEQQLGGSFNLAAPIGHSTFGELLEACRQVTGSTAELEWVPHDFLIAQGVREWTELPLWRPYTGTWRVEAARARAAGLTCRPLTATVADTWQWLASGGTAVASGRAAELGLSSDKESRILAAWADARVVG